MRKVSTLARGMAIGAGMMYLLDREQGRRRRARVRDRIRHEVTDFEAALDRSARDLRNRTHGAVAGVRGLFRTDDADDLLVRDRIRSTMGRVVSHPGAIDVMVDNGHAHLHGDILAAEYQPLLNTVLRVRGVSDVQDELRVHRTAQDVPALQGGRHREPRFEFRQENWTPAARMGAGLAGGMTALFGARRGGIGGGVLSLAGLGLLARATTNMPTKRLIGTGGGRRAIDIDKSIEIKAPVNEVYDFWKRFENFPRFMSHIRDVTKNDGETSHWVAAGPIGTTVEWDAEVTEDISNQVIAWKSVHGASVGSAGRVRFVPTSAGTRLDIHLTYNPPAGAIGHAVASFFGADPKHAMNDDLLRLKTLLEQEATTISDRGKSVH
jgi:uncharacterized membrane protein